MDTIFALASGRGKAGVSVIRISGPDAFDIAQAVCGAEVPERRPVLRTLRYENAEAIDTALVIGFAEGASFTGEPTVEFQVHGSIAVINAVLARLGEDPRARAAEPGEFTRRALENERLDLSQVEGLADLIDAETEVQRKQAHRLLSGDLGNLVEGWRVRLIRAAALVEATIDFADEEVPEDVTPEVRELLTRVRDELRTEVAGSRVSERIRDGFEVAVIGPPNAGKSTLVNYLVGRDVAITSDIPGTTRDVIEVRLDVLGLPVTILDTAGLRDASDEIEEQGIIRARSRAGDADLRIHLLEEPGGNATIEAEPDDIVLVGKADVHGDVPGSISGVTGFGVDALLEEIGSKLSKRAAGAATATRFRQRVAMEQALEYIASGLAELESGPQRIEYAAEEMLQAVRALDSLIGRVDVEHLLDEIFQCFCLGK